MPILPIDLQTLFAQMNNVGKEQAVQREIAPQHQALQGNQMVRQATEQARSVNQTRDVGEGIEKVKEEEERRRRRRRRGADEKPEGKQQDDHARRELQDPALGRHIDIVR